MQVYNNNFVRQFLGCRKV